MKRVSNNNYMGSIKQKEQVNDNPDEDIPIASKGTRTQELAQRRYKKQFEYADDIMPMLKKVGGTLVDSKQNPPQADKRTYTGEEWKKLNEKSHNSRNNTYYSWG